MKIFFKSLDLKVYDLGCYYEKQNLTHKEISLNRIGHLTPRGHQLVAGWIGQYWQGNILSPECFLPGITAVP